MTYMCHISKHGNVSCNFLNTYKQIIAVILYVKVLTKMYKKKKKQKTASEAIKGKSSHLMIYAALKMKKKRMQQTSH